MSNSDSGIRKSTVGAIAIGCLLMAGGIFLFSPAHEAVLAGFWRVGLMMFALWLALPAKGEKFAAASMLPIIVGAAALIALSGRRLLIVLPFLIVIGIAVALLRPRRRRR